MTQWKKIIKVILNTFKEENFKSSYGICVENILVIIDKCKKMNCEKELKLYLINQVFIHILENV